GGDRGEVCEDFVVRQMELTRQQVREMVGWSWNVLADGMVAVSALVEGQEAEKESSGALGGGGATMLPVDRGLVVAQRYYRLAAQWDGVGKDVEMCQVSREFQLGVVEIAGRVLVGDQAVLEMRRERPPPGDAGAGVVGREPNPPHSL
ncbi:MAG: hypothetical protein ACK53L_12550, partial [Pirellulaceae bacterium]